MEAIAWDDLGTPFDRAYFGRLAQLLFEYRSIELTVTQDWELFKSELLSKPFAFAIIDCYDGETHSEPVGPNRAAEVRELTTSGISNWNDNSFPIFL